MARTGTILWRLVVVGLFIAIIAFAIHTYDRRGRVETGRMLDASVSIRTISHVTIDRFGDSVWETGGGSGFLVSRETCEIWTNHHVVENAAIIEVFPSRWHKSSGIPATVVNFTPRTDIAIVRMQSCDDMPQAVLGDSGRVQAGDVTYAVGNPLGRHPDSISRGIISHTDREMAGDISYLQTDAAINPGNSGGALFNRRGEVIGINTAIARTASGANVGVGFAIPINAAKRIVSSLRQGPPSWGDAGIASMISSLTPEEAAVFKVPDGRAALVLTDSPSEGPSAGQLFSHDVIYTIDGDRFQNVHEARRLLSRRRAGETMLFELIRAGEALTAEVTLGEGWNEGDTPLADEYEGYLGLTLEMWNQQEGELGQFDKPVITQVHSLGPAHKAHIASSQHSVLLSGPVMIPITLDVKTVTGVAFDGVYHDIADIDELSRYSELAFNANKPLLLEIELWIRSDTRDPRSPLERQGTAFFKLDPAPAGHRSDGAGHAELLMVDAFTPIHAP